MVDTLPLSRIGISSDGKRLKWRAYVILIFLCLCFFLPGLASLPPTDRDESLFAQASKQMVETGDHVDIKFLGTPRYKKPIGIYWLQSLSVRLLSPHHLNEILAYRVPSMMGATLAVLLTAALGALLFNSVTGLAAGVMLASCVNLVIESHLATTDAALLASIMLAQYTLARAYVLPQSGWKNAVVFWSAIGIGILLKGPVILLPLFSTLLWLRVSEKDLSWFRRLKPFVGIPYALLLVAPWLIAINLASHGQFMQQSAGHDFLAKLWQGQDRGFLPPGLYALVFPATFFPFSLFALLAIPAVWASRHDKAVRFCLGWIVPTWIVFELSLTKLPHYVLPVYPAIALLTAKFFFDGSSDAMAERRRWTTIAVSLWLLIGMALAVAFSIVPVIIDHQIVLMQMLASGLLLLAQGAGLLLFLQNKKAQSIAVLIIGTLMFSSTLLAVTLPSRQRLWVAREIMQQASAVAPCSDFSVVSAGYTEPSLAFLAGTETKFVPNGTYAAAEMQHDLCRVGVVSKHLLVQFLTASSDFPTQPVSVGSTVEGINTGHGANTELYFYVMPPYREPTPVYP